MYDTTDSLGLQEVAPGTTVLGVGPPMVGKQAFGYRILAEGLGHGDGAVLVSTSRGAATARDRIADRLEERSALDRLTVVDATGGTDEDSGPDGAVRVVGSPADLTGIGIGVTDAIERYREADVDRVRVVVDTVSAMTVYTEFERVYRFLHTLVGRLDAAGSLGVFFLQSDAGERETNTVTSLFDGVIEFEDRESGPEFRLRGLGGPDSTTDWKPVTVEDGGVATAGEAGSGSVTGREPLKLTGTDETLPSLHAAIEELEDETQTLTLCNVDGDAEAIVDDLKGYFDRLNVVVRTAELSTATPRNTAVLHYEEAPIAVAPIEAVRGAIRVAGDSASDLGSLDDRPTLLREADREGYGIEDGGKRYMIRVSRMVEGEALDVGTGTIHAGFQDLGRLTDDYGTREMYERLAATDVDVHLYGQPGEVPGPEQYTLHARDTEELARSWFVVFDGGGDPARKLALVTEEREPDRFYGFWTRRPAFVDRILAYLERTYGRTSPNPDPGSEALQGADD